GKVGRTRVKVAGSAVMFAAAGQQADILVYHTNAYSRADGENKIKFQVFSNARNEFEGKFVAYGTSEIGGSLHRGRVYRVQFNDQVQYPQIVGVLTEYGTSGQYLSTATNCNV